MVIVIRGDLFEMTFNKHFDVIAHGVNCFCTQKSGIAKPMTEYFETDNPLIYSLEHKDFYGDRTKLGKIQYNSSWVDKLTKVEVVNCYTQYRYGTDKIHLNYKALRSCMRKINKNFSGLRVGLPLIGGGLAGGDYKKIREIMEQELVDVEATLVLK
jgi:O-acetyl-ADP-ribose deacetylase (regulator of RNase III)